VQKQIYLADWIIPVSSPVIHYGGMLVENNRIQYVNDADTVLKKYSSISVKNFGNAVIVPSWVNAHCHLELSAFAGKITDFKDFVDWIRQLIALRTKTAPNIILEIADKAARELAASGCTLVGDITNGDLLSSDLFSDLFERVVFYETLGFEQQKAKSIFDEAVSYVEQENDQAIIIPHAPYSTSASLIRMIAEYNHSLSIHVAESGQESEFLANGTGSFKDFLIERAVWDEHWQAPGKSPIEYLNQLKILNDKTLLVHGAQVSEQDINLIKESGATVCVCARSNAQTRVGEMPLSTYQKVGIPLCIGTDSLASNIDLDMNNEIYYIYKRNKQIEPAGLISMATINGAKILGRSDRYGSLEKGKQARFNVFISEGKIVNEPEKFVVSKSWSNHLCY